MTLSSSFAVLPDGVWSKWTGWSECSKTCFNHVDDVGIRQRFRSCSHTLTPFNHTHSDSACDGDSEEQEPCNTVQCPGITDKDTTHRNHNVQNSVPSTLHKWCVRLMKMTETLISVVYFQWMVAGLLGHRGLSVHQSATLVSKQESDSAVPRPHSMGAAAAPGHTYRQGTATPTPAQVLHDVILLLKPIFFFVFALYFWLFLLFYAYDTFYVFLIFLFFYFSICIVVIYCSKMHIFFFTMLIHILILEWEHL